MVYDAAFSQERGLKTPLLVGGATTSKMHTAVKIVTQYSGAWCLVSSKASCQQTHPLTCSCLQSHNFC